MPGEAAAGGQWTAAEKLGVLRSVDSTNVELERVIADLERMQSDGIREKIAVLETKVESILVAVASVPRLETKLTEFEATVTASARTVRVVGALTITMLLTVGGFTAKMVVENVYQRLDAIEQRVGDRETPR